jgi:uncharacterized membrane protein (DUF4010 family)
MNDLDVAVRFAVALGLGVFLGLERERKKVDEKDAAGVRTIALVALAGAIAGYMDVQLGLGWLALLVFAAIATLVIVAYVVTAARGDAGFTTEVSAILAFLLGVLCVRGELSLAASLAVATALLLALRDWLHALAKRIESADVEATLKFAIITLIVLPLVPDKSYGPPPFDVVNPYRIWLMVVLISAIDFASSVLVKIVGTEHGIGFTGLLGGLVSSTAATLGFVKRSRAEPALCPSLALGILLAWTVMFARVLVVTGIVARALTPRLAIGLGLPALACVLATLWVWKKNRSPQRGTVDVGSNPFELGQAIKFGLLFGVVIFVARAAEVNFGTSGLYVTGLLAGSTDVDAISLSMATLVNRQPESLDVGARTIAIAVLSNTIVKSGMVLLLGSSALRKLMLPLVGLVVLAGAIALVLM